MYVWIFYAILVVVSTLAGLWYLRTGIAEARQPRPFHPWVPIASGIASLIAAAICLVLMVLALIFGG